MNHPRLSIIPARAATDRALKPRDLQVLCVLGRHTDDLGWCRRSQVKMAQEMDCARSTVFESVERLVASGYLERHVQESATGRDSAHVFRVILDPVHPDVSSVRDADDPCRYTGTPAAISAPPAGPEAAPPAGSGPAPINDPSLTTPSNESSASTRECVEEKESGVLDDPAKFELRVKRIAAKTSWPKWEKSPTQWAVQQFARLTDAERLEAERLAPAYAAHCGAGVVPLGVYFRDRKWTDLPASVLQATEAASSRETGPRKYEPVFGPVWAARRTLALLDGPLNPLPEPRSTFIAKLIKEDSDLGRVERKRHRMENGYPLVKGFDAFGVLNTGNPEDEAKHQVARTMTVAVPVGSEQWFAWKNLYDELEWPWIPDPGRQPVVYFPVGGPERLKEFEQAIRGNGNDGDR